MPQRLKHNILLSFLCVNSAGPVNQLSRRPRLKKAGSPKDKLRRVENYYSLEDSVFNSLSLSPFLLSLFLSDSGPNPKHAYSDSLGFLVLSLKLLPTSMQLLACHVAKYYDQKQLTEERVYFGSHFQRACIHTVGEGLADQIFFIHRKQRNQTGSRFRL